MRVRDALLDLVVPFSCMLFVLSLVAVPWHIVAPNGPGWGGDSLRRWGIDLPDSFVELLTGVLLVLSAERAILRIRKFFLSQLFSSERSTPLLPPLPCETSSSPTFLPIIPSHV